MAQLLLNDKFYLYYETNVMKFAKVLAALLLSVASFSASSTVITKSLPQTVNGQDFVFDFTGLSQSFTGGAKLTVTARGDFSPNTDSEFLSISAEDISFGDFTYKTNNGVGNGGGNNWTAFSAHDNQFTKSFTLSNSQLVGLLADQVLSVSALLSSQVNIFGANSKVTATFEYTPVEAGAPAQGGTVPEPGSLLLVGIALAALTAARRRKQ
jgi:hypothetical protein